MKNSPNVLIVSPAIVSHNLDPHTGIPFLPHMAAHFAGALESFCSVSVLDAFGIDSRVSARQGEFTFFGVDADKLLSLAPSQLDIVFIYCRTVEDLISSEMIAKAFRASNSKIKIAFFENIQTVNSFSLSKISRELLEGTGANMAILGEPEVRAEQIVNALMSNSKFSEISGICYFDSNRKFIETKAEPFNKNLDSLPLPLWSKWQLSGYWDIGFAHAPIKSRTKFLPLLTSRGCPYRCTFCISPSLNPTWRSRSAVNVVDEIEYFNQKMGITDFHVSDLDPTVMEKRTRAICEEILRRGLKISWKLAQGTKIETIKSVETLDMLKKSGCEFISFSPESGSEGLMKDVINKPFDYEHCIKMVEHMNLIGIKTQACFVAGIPGETSYDRKKSLEFVRRLVKAGVDEIAVTIFTPLPGAALADSIGGYTHYSQLTHSPTWRSDYLEVNRFRLQMYSTFFLWKLTFPLKVVREFMGFITGNYQTKMEMSLRKILIVHFMAFRFEINRLIRTSKEGCK